MDHRNRDRGALKWTSLMLPEHVEMIKQVWKEDERIEKPILNEQQWEEIGFALQLALKDGLAVEVKHHNGFDFSYCKLKLQHIAQIRKQLMGKTIDSKEKAAIDLVNISAVKFL